MSTTGADTRLQGKETQAPYCSRWVCCRRINPAWQAETCSILVVVCIDSLGVRAMVSYVMIQTNHRGVNKGRKVNGKLRSRSIRDGRSRSGGDWLPRQAPHPRIERIPFFSFPSLPPFLRVGLTAYCCCSFLEGSTAWLGHDRHGARAHCQLSRRRSSPSTTCAGARCRC